MNWSEFWPKPDNETAATVAAQGALPVPVGDQPQPLDDTRLAEYAALIERTTPVGAVTAAPGMAAALLTEVQRLKAELAAEASAHRFTLRQRNNRSNRITHLRDLANAAATGGTAEVQALIDAARDTLAASVDDHTNCTTPTEEAAS
ncbi:hypothetical protein [Streptomyces luteogriseus]|uniref:hypothetical protein n=1 Tax=Streptomyces luteogriseus TaxID=68233 RepID=UPI00380ED5A1